MQRYIDNMGQVWFTGDVLSFGTYGGGGSVAKANIRFLIECSKIDCEYLYKIQTDHRHIYFYNDNIERINVHYDVVIIKSFYGETAFVKESERTKDILASLEGYPVLDGEILSEVEREMEEEVFWDDVLFSLLTFGTKNFYKYFTTYKERYRKLIWQAYKEAMEQTNTYPIPEYDTVYIDTDRIGSIFVCRLLSLFAEYHKQRWKKKPYKRQYIYI